MSVTSGLEDHERIHFGFERWKMKVVNIFKSYLLHVMTVTMMSMFLFEMISGAFIGVSLEGNLVATRMDANLRFYGDPYLTTTDILLGTVERPKAAAPLYSALNDLYWRLTC